MKAPDSQKYLLPTNKVGAILDIPLFGAQRQLAVPPAPAKVFSCRAFTKLMSKYVDEVNHR